MNYYLGIDCGGTFIKAALFDKTGEMFSCVRENVQVISEQAGYAERDMDELWQICARVIRQTIERSQVSPNILKG